MGQESSYLCAQHHEHKTMEDVEMCNNIHDFWNSGAHRLRMFDKFLQAYRNGAIDEETLIKLAYNCWFSQYLTN